MKDENTLVDYKYIYDKNDYVCKYATPLEDKTVLEPKRGSDGVEYEMPEIENALECAELGDGHSWSKGRTKSVLTFNRYVDLYGDPNLPEVEGMYKADLDDDPKVGDRIAPSP